jgi:hypothetical protein
MSLKYEQYNSLKLTRSFLCDLLSTKTRPKTIRETKERVYQCLRHFPRLEENGKPIFSNDDFTG